MVIESFLLINHHIAKYRDLQSFYLLFLPKLIYVSLSLILGFDVL